MSRTALVGVLLVVAVSGCSRLLPKLDEVLPDNRKDYQKSQNLPDLEIPPDLSTDAIRDRMAIPEGGKTAKFSSFQERRAEQQKVTEVEKSQNAAIRVLENEHVLAVEGAPVQVWPKLRDFWKSLGYTLDLDDADLGVIETAWSEDKNKLKRDKFKIFAEAGTQTGTTVLYVSHEGQEMSPRGEELVWQRKPRDTETERGMTERLQQYLSGQGAIIVAAPTGGSGHGGDAKAAPAPAVTAAGSAAPEAAVAAVSSTSATAADTPQPPKARRTNDGTPAVGGAAPEVAGRHHAEIVSVGGGKVYLSVAEDFPSAWKTTGKALEQVGVTVKESDKGRGVYIIKVDTAGDGGESSTGMLSKLKFWDRNRGAELQVSLTGVGEKTEVVVLDRDGRWDTGDAAGRLLNKLHDALNSGHI